MEEKLDKDKSHIKRSPGEGKYPFQYSGLENSMDCIVNGVSKNSLVAQTVKRLRAMQETWVRSLGREDPLEDPPPVLLPGKSHGQRSLVGYSPWGHKESDTTKQLHFTSKIGND